MLSIFLKYQNILRIAQKLVFIQNLLTLKMVLMGKGKRIGTIDLIRLGTPYGGWFVPRNMTSTNKSLVVVSAGLGHDTSFDFEIIKNGCFVLGLDPLLECCQIAQKQLGANGDFKILNLGLASFTGTQIFYAPKISHHDSYSTINVQQVSKPESFAFPVISLGDLFLQNKKLQQAEFSMLKMDVEGAELEILLESTTDVNRFDFLAVEMDFLSLIPFFSTFTRIKRILIARKILVKLETTSGWHLIKTENFNFFWAKS